MVPDIFFLRYYRGTLYLYTHGVTSLLHQVVSGHLIMPSFLGNQGWCDIENDEVKGEFRTKMDALPLAVPLKGQKRRRHIVMVSRYIPTDLPGI